ncbi:MAG TPA: ABC transporter permease [Candidatus Pullichristensenella avicola]|nr:ABC transporter permease [Candidatus Pullichristensenella avicola]
MQNTKMGFKDLLIRFSKRHSIYLVLLGVILVSICLSDSFTRPANILNITRQISVSTIVAYGMTIIIICGMIDLSAGSVIALAGVLGVMTYVQTQSVLLAVLVSMLIGAATGAVSGLIITRFKVPAFITTMAMQMSARGLVLLITDAIPIYSIGRVSVLGKGAVLGIPVPVFFMMMIAFITWFLLNRCKFGRYIYAIGGNMDAAIAAGINVNRTMVSATILNGVFTGLAGIILMGRLNGGMPQAGEDYEFDAISAAVLGGTSIAGGYGTVSGTIAGAFILGIFNNILNLLAVDSYMQEIIKGGVIVVAVAMDVIQRKKQR